MEETFINDKGEEVKRQRCEVYSRVVGYIRPIDAWNEGKKSEFNDRVNFNPNL